MKSLIVLAGVFALTLSGTAQAEVFRSAPLSDAELTQSRGGFSVGGIVINVGELFFDIPQERNILTTSCLQWIVGGVTNTISPFSELI